MIEVCDAIVDVAPFINFLCDLINLKVLIEIFTKHIARAFKVSEPSFRARPLKFKVWFPLFGMILWKFSVSAWILQPTIILLKAHRCKEDKDEDHEYANISKFG